MPIPSKYLADFKEGQIYHIYNRTNNKELLFHTAQSKTFFLQKIKEFLFPYLDIYCWCLLSNHFHLLVRIKPESVIKGYIKEKSKSSITITERKYLDRQVDFSVLVEKTFKRFFQSYALAFNKVFQRSGNLFYRPFKRINIDKSTQFTQIIIYIHANPLKHKLVSDFTHYKWSSWNSILFCDDPKSAYYDIINWFGDKKQFIKAHRDLILYYYETDVSIE